MATGQEELLLEWEAVLLEALHTTAELINIDLENELTSNSSIVN